MRSDSLGCIVSSERPLRSSHPEPSPLALLPPHSPRPGEGNAILTVLAFSLFSRSGGVRWEKRAGVMRVLGGGPPPPPPPAPLPGPADPPPAKWSASRRG